MRRFSQMIFFFLLLFSCHSPRQNESSDELKCPMGHTDEIIKIEYGMPDESMFEAADRGEIMLGGCEVSEDAPGWYCTKHRISF
ncbi:MAG: hypothetical protein ACOZCO_13680 [Bacteroidota bacterium]